MNNAVQPLPQTFEANRILATFPDFDGLQIAVTHSVDSDGLKDGTGSLYDYREKRFTRDTSHYTTLNQHFRETYMEAVIAAVNVQAERDQVCLGRIRIMKLLPKTCLTLHSDPEEFRYHIPLISSLQCFFVSGDRVEYMAEIGRLYRFRTAVPHTAVNASFEARTHLVFDTF